MEEHDDELMALVEEELQAFEQVGDWWFVPPSNPCSHDWLEPLPVDVASTVDCIHPHQQHALNQATTGAASAAITAAVALAGTSSSVHSRKRRRRPRTELIELRHQVLVLEQRLQHLRNPPSESELEPPQKERHCKNNNQTSSSSSLSSSSSSSSCPSFASLCGSGAVEPTAKVSNGTDVSWQCVAQREQIVRRLVEQTNQQLKQELAMQIHQARAMRRHVMRQREQFDMACWVANDPMISRAALEVSATSLKRRKRVPRKQEEEEEARDDSPARAEARLWLILQRLDFVWQQLDGVFRQHVLSQQMAPSASSTRCHQLKIRCSFNNTEGLSSTSSDNNNASNLFLNDLLFEDGFVELVGSTVTCFDAKTLLEILWKCFIWDSQRRNVIQPVDSTAQPTVFIPAVLNSTKVPTRQRIETSTCARMALKPGRLVDAIDSHVVDDVVHGRAHFVIALGTSRSEQHNQAQVEAQGALKRLESGFVCETFGRVELDDVTQIAFNRSEWFRVEALDDGRSVIHHVHRVRPLIPRLATGSCSSKPYPVAKVSHHQQQLPTPPQRRNQYLQLFAELLQRTHGDMWTQFQELIVDEFMEQLAALRQKNQAGATIGWPLDGKI